MAIHFILAVAVGYLAGKHYKNMPLAIVVAVCGGFFIDLDHVLEYLLVFGPHFNILYFIQGRQFLTSDQTHLWFHAWEYIPLLLGLGYLLRKNKIVQTILITLAFSMGIHLLSDTIINDVPINFYSLIYREQAGFQSKNLIGSENYRKNQELKQDLGL